jgi:hypothetical protein
MSGYSAEQIRGCRCSSRPQVILSVGECKIARERFESRRLWRRALGCWQKLRIRQKNQI